MNIHGVWWTEEASKRSRVKGGQTVSWQLDHQEIREHIVEWMELVLERPRFEEYIPEIPEVPYSAFYLL